MTINEIINGNYKVTEKQAILETYKRDVLKEIEEAKRDIVKGYKYCPECKEYYREKTFEIKHKIEKREVCTFHSLCEFDDDTYEDKVCDVQYSICPMGHKIEENVTW